MKPQQHCRTHTFELALKLVLATPSLKPCSFAISSALSWVTPTKDTSGWVKQAAGMDRWFSTLGRPSMFSTALMPCSTKMNHKRRGTAAVARQGQQQQTAQLEAHRVGNDRWVCEEEAHEVSCWRKGS